MAEFNKVDILRSLYEENALPPDKMEIIKSLEVEGRLDEALNALSQNKKFLQSLSARTSDLSGKVPLERKSPEYYRQRAAEFRAETPPADQGNFVKQMAGQARPFLEAGGATAGAIVGAGAGMLGGPGAPVTAPTGAVIGGGLGFAMGSELADMLENWAGTREPQPLVVEIPEAARKFAEGAAYETGGQIIGPALGAAGKAAMKIPAVEYTVLAGKEALGRVPAMTQEGIKRLAGNYLHANTSKGPIIAKNIETAKAIEEQFPGLKFTYGEITGDPNLIKMEKAAMGEPGQFAQDFIERQKSNDAAIKRGIEAQRPQGTTGDVIEAFGAKEAEAKAAETAAQQRLSSETEKIGMGQGTLEAGQTMRAEIETGKTAAKKEGKKLYKDVEQFGIDASKLSDDLDQISEPMFRGEDIEKNVPWDKVNRIKQTLEASDNVLTPKDLDGIQSEIKEEIRNIKRSDKVNNRRISRLTQINNKIEGLLQSASTAATPAAQKLGTARKFWKENVIQKFKSGNVGDILQPGRSGYRVEDSQVASRFIKPGPRGKQSAMEFKRAVGDNTKAMSAIEDAYKQDLLAKFPGEEITESGLRRWLNRNKLALDELGLTNKFDSIKKAREQLTDAIGFRKDFEKSEAAKFLGADPDIAIKKALGEVNVGKAATKLMQATGGNKTAQAGLRNSLEDFILDKSRNLETGMITKVDTLDKLTQKYRPAFNVFYEGDKTALKNWDSAREAFRIAQKSRKIPGFTGSETAPLLMTAVFKILGVSEGRIGNLVSAFLKPLKDTEATKVRQLVNRALLDPDFAYTLMLAADAAQPGVAKGTLPRYHLAKRGTVVKEGILPAYLNRRLEQHLATITGATQKPLELEEPLK